MPISSHRRSLLLGCLATAPLLYPGQASATSVYVSVPSLVFAGSTFSAYVAVSQFPYDVGGFQFDLSYTPTILATSVTEGNFLPAGGPTLFGSGNINASTGNITDVYDVYFGTPASPAGGSLAEITFQSFGVATSTITLDDITLFDTSGNLLTEDYLSSTASLLVTNNPFTVIPPFTPPALSYSDSVNVGSGAPPSASPVPEPSTLLLIGSGISALPWIQRRARDRH